MTREEFKNLTAAGPVILDGATGSNLMKAGMPKGVCTEQWILEHKDILINLKQGYACLLYTSNLYRGPYKSFLPFYKT